MTRSLISKIYKRIPRTTYSAIWLWQGHYFPKSTRRSHELHTVPSGYDKVIIFQNPQEDPTNYIQCHLVMTRSLFSKIHKKIPRTTYSAIWLWQGQSSPKYIVWLSGWTIRCTLWVKSFRFDLWPYACQVTLDISGSPLWGSRIYPGNLNMLVFKLYFCHAVSNTQPWLPVQGSFWVWAQPMGDIITL